MSTASVIVGSGEARWIVNGPAPGIAKTIWSGIEGAVLGEAFVSRIAWRREPGPESLALDTTNPTVTATPVTSVENADVSPVPRFVAVATTGVPTGTLVRTVVTNDAAPVPSVATGTEPSSVAAGPPA